MVTVICFLIIKKLHEVVQHSHYHNQWWSDDALIFILTNTFHMTDDLVVDHTSLNKAILNDMTVFLTIDTTRERSMTLDIIKSIGIILPMTLGANREPISTSSHR